MNPLPRIGIVGARGIGKHHAKWFALCGCDVTAIYGTTEESAQAAAAGLRETFGFKGRAFHDWDRFVREGGFDACAVCSPYESHWENVRDLAAAGKHLLCEKPLVWHWDYTPAQILEEGTRLVEAAAHHEVILGVNAQYPAVFDGWRELYRQVRGVEPEFRSVSFVVETKGAPRSTHGAAEVWVDLGPHPIAVVDRILPGSVDWDTLECSGGPREAVLDLTWVSGSRTLDVHMECRRVEGPPLRRTIGNQDLTVNYEACNRDGQFVTRLSTDGREWFGPDLMRLSIERFVDAVRHNDPSRLLLDGVASLRQLEVLAGIWQRCWRTP